MLDYGINSLRTIIFGNKRDFKSFLSFIQYPLNNFIAKHKKEVLMGDSLKSLNNHLKNEFRRLFDSFYPKKLLSPQTREKVYEIYTTLILREIKTWKGKDLIAILKDQTLDFNKLKKFLDNEKEMCLLFLIFFAKNIYNVP